MRCTRIKQHLCRDWVDEKRTKNNVRGFGRFLSSDMVQAAPCSISLVVLVLPRGSTALTLVGSRRAEARCRRLLQRALLREVSRLATGVASAALAAVGGVERVAVASREVPARGTVAGILTVWVIGPGGLRGKPLWRGRSPGWGQAAGPLSTRSTLTHHSSLAALAGSLVLVFNHYCSIHHSFQIRIVHGYKVGLQLLL
jgi:hypothetical protein